jgi:hypothetical protein
MSIEQVSAYRVGELMFPTIQEAQKSELAALFSVMPNSGGVPLDIIASTIVEHTDEVVAILTCQPKAKAKSPRKPRSDIGKKRAAKDKATLPV